MDYSDEQLGQILRCARASGGKPSSGEQIRALLASDLLTDDERVAFAVWLEDQEYRRLRPAPLTHRETKHLVSRGLITAPPQIVQLVHRVPGTIKGRRRPARRTTLSGAAHGPPGRLADDDRPRPASRLARLLALLRRRP